MSRHPPSGFRVADAAALEGEHGFSLVEATVAMTLFLVLATAVSGLLSSGIAAQNVARQRTLAKQQALAEIESIRRLPYDSVGTVAGNPPGVLAATKTLSLTGLNATVGTQVQYVNDPTPTSYTTTANYKKVTITVRRTRDAKQLIRSVTYVAPTARAPYGGINFATINVEVVDDVTDEPIPGAGVSLSTGPSAPRSDTTDQAGVASFPALQPNPTSGSTAFYDIAAGATGYVTLSDDVSPGAAAHVQLAPGQTFNTAIRMYIPAKILVDIPGWTPTAGTVTTIHVGSGRRAGTFTYNGGTLEIPTLPLGGEAVVPGLPYTVAATTVVTATGATSYAPAVSATVPSNYPTVLTQNFSTTLGAVATTRTLTVRVRKGSTSGSAVCGARVDISGGPQAIYLTGKTVTGGGCTGNINFTVPQGTGYTATAWNAAGSAQNQVTGISVSSNATVTVVVP